MYCKLMYCFSSFHLIQVGLCLSFSVSPKVTDCLTQIIKFSFLVSSPRHSFPNPFSVTSICVLMVPYHLTYPSFIFLPLCTSTATYFRSHLLVSAFPSLTCFHLLAKNSYFLFLSIECPPRPACLDCCSLWP